VPADGAVIAIEPAGAFWGPDTDKAPYRHSRADHAREFPNLRRVSRTTFARRAANPWRVERLAHRRLAGRLTAGDPLWLVDSPPVPACPFARATVCRRSFGEAADGYDHLIRRTSSGFRRPLRTRRDGVIPAAALAPARVADAAAVAELSPPPGRVGVGGRADRAPERRAEPAAAGVALLAPDYQKSRGPDPARSARPSSVRDRVEAVPGQLADRYRVKRTWAKDLWHWCHRAIRKVLSRTVMVALCPRAGHRPRHFDAPAA
jgi:hypothetical protein